MLLTYALAGIGLAAVIYFILRGVVKSKSIVDLRDKP